MIIDQPPRILLRNRTPHTWRLSILRRRRSTLAGTMSHWHSWIPKNALDSYDEYLLWNSDADSFLSAINVPSLEEWTHSVGDDQHDCVTMISLLDHSNCSLKVLSLGGGSNFSEDVYTLLQATPSLEQLYLAFAWKFQDISIMDDIFTRISRTTTGSDGVSSVEGATSGSFFPHLRFVECEANSATISPFTWDRIPQLCYQGHRRSLALKSWAHKSHISDETALEL